ncbi:MAG: glycosyltransferase family 39 protein [Elusimicrobiota bacterium]
MNKKIFLLIFILAILVRFIYLLVFSGLQDTHFADSYEYNNYAVSLISGEGYRNGEIRSFRIPGYPIFLASIYSVFGQSQPAVKIIQVIISGFNCILIYFVALKIADSKTALLSALISCFYFDLFIWPSHIMTETIFTFFVTLLILSLLYTDNVVISAVCLGLTTLIRPEGALISPFICFWFFIRYRDSLTIAIKKSILMGICLILMIAPWTIRNYFVHRAFVPLTTLGGNVFWGSNNDLSGGREYRRHIENHIKKLPNQLTEIELDKLGYEEGKKWLKNQSLPKILKLYFLKIAAFLTPFSGIGGGWYGYLSVYNLTYGLLFPFWIFGMYLIFKPPHKEAILLFFVILSGVMTTLIFYGLPRFRAGISPCIIIFAASGMMHFFSIFKKKITIVFTSFIWFFLNIMVYFYSEPISSTIRSVVNIIRKTG